MLRGIRIGEIDRRISIQVKIKSNNEYNEDVYSWVDLATNVPAKVKELTGEEEFEADKLTYVQVIVFSIRFRQNLNSEMQIVYKGNNYSIISIVETQGRKNILDIKAVIRE